MKKAILSRLLLFAALSASFFIGCSDSKKHVIVKEKTELNIDSYRQASDTSGEAKGSEDSNQAASTDSSSSDLNNVDPSGSDNTGSGGNSDHTCRNTLACRLQVPETYTFSGEFPNSTLQLSCQAEIQVPDIDQVSIYKVRQKPFDQAWIDQVTNTFFGECPVYEYSAYVRATKAELLETLKKLKAFQAEGNMDPYGYIESARKTGFQNPETFYSLKEHIEDVEDALQDAPESQLRNEVSPGFYPTAENGYDPSTFFGMVEMDNNRFFYKLKKFSSLSMEISIERRKTYGATSPWSGYEWTLSPPYAGYDSRSHTDGFPSPEKAEKMAGITSGQAVELADHYMKKLGLSEFSSKYTDLSLCVHSYRMLTDNITYPDAAYQIMYTRDIDGFPVTPDFGGGTVVGTDDVTTDLCGYEHIAFYVNQDGLMKADIRNLYEVEKPLLDNVELLSFPEIIEIFGEMMPIRYREGTDKITIDRITLGYTKIYDPGMDGTVGLLVPAWDFYGIWERIPDDGEPYVLDYSTRSLLTINAADGTVIDREYGY